MIDCPCIDCICLPVCREKSYATLMKDCRLATDFVLIANGSINSPLHRDDVRMKTLHSILKPIQWTLDNGNGNLIVQWTAEGIERNVDHRHKH